MSDDRCLLQPASIWREMGMRQGDPRNLDGAGPAAFQTVLRISRGMRRRRPV
jgi:hypothetical protein